MLFLHMDGSHHFDEVEAILPRRVCGTDEGSPVRDGIRFLEDQRVKVSTVGV